MKKHNAMWNLRNKIKIIKVMLVATPLALNAQQPAKEKSSALQFGEMTTLEQFGGPSLGTYAPSSAEKNV